jgi:hypothetical protein
MRKPLGQFLDDANLPCRDFLPYPVPSYNQFIENLASINKLEKYYKKLQKTRNHKNQKSYFTRQRPNHP